MAHSHRPDRHRPASPVRRAARVLAAFCIAGLSYGALTTGAFGPDAGDVPQELAVREVATLSYSGTDLVITGSVGHIFRTSAFVGPNRSEKRNRERISVDVASFSRSFDEQRTRLAALRVMPPQLTDFASPRLAIADGPLAGNERPAPVQVASIEQPEDSSALLAIESLAPEGVVPLPLIPSQQLAYARANAPVTPEYQTSAQLLAADKQLWCMATGIYFEARGESYRGQAAVAQVVLNRTKHRLYPKTVCAVIFQNQHRRNACQFSFACDGIPERITERKAWEQAQEIARKVISGELYLTEVGNATHYHATYVKPHWAPRMVKLAKVGQHIFYRFKSGWSFG